MNAFRKWLVFVFCPWLPAQTLKMLNEQGEAIDKLLKLARKQRDELDAREAQAKSLNDAITRIKIEALRDQEAKEEAQKLAARYQAQAEKLFEDAYSSHGIDGTSRWKGLGKQILHRVEKDLPNMRVFVASISAEARVDRESYLDVPIITLISKLRVGAVNAPPEIWAGQVGAEMKQAVLIAFQKQSILNQETP
jgi:hypothetical protein